MDSPLKAFVRNSILPLAIYDRDMRLLDLSDAMKRMYQVSDDLIGKLHYETFPDLPAHWIAAHQSALKGNISEHIEEPYMLSNGAIGWHRWQCSPWHNADGEIGGIIITAEDVTTRKEREVELNRVLARFELIQQAAKIGMWDWDIAGKNITLNSEYYEILGWNKDRQITYQDFLHLIHIDDASRVNDAMNAALEGQGAYEAEFRIIRMNDSKLRWVKDKGTIEFDASGAPVRGYGAIVDVTEQKLLLDEHLKLSGEQHHKYLDSMFVGVSVVDRLGVIVYVNDKLLEMLGYSEEEMVGKSLYNFIDAELRHQAAKNLQDRFAGIPDQHIFCVKHKDGSDVWLLISGQPVIEDGEVVGNISVHMDYTERKKIDAYKDKKIELLERLLALNNNN